MSSLDRSASLRSPLLFSADLDLDLDALIAPSFSADLERDFFRPPLDLDRDLRSPSPDFDLDLEALFGDLEREETRA